MLGHNQRDGIFLPTNQGKKWRRGRRQCNDCIDEEHRWRDRDKLQTCQRCHKKSERTKRETVLKFEELFEKWKEVSQQITMKDFWSFGLASIKPQRATAFSKSGTSCFKLPCDISQPVLRDSFLIHSKPYTRKKTSHQTRFSILHSCHQKIKFKRQTKNKSPEMRLRSSKISEKLCLPPVESGQEGLGRSKLGGILLLL